MLEVCTKLQDVYIAIQDKQSDYNNENVSYPSNSDVSVVTSEERQSQIKWNMETMQEGENILKK